MKSDSIPDGWRLCKLTDIAEDHYGLVDGPFGSDLKSSEYVDSGVPVIRGSNLSLGERRFDASEFVFVTETKARALNRALARPGDIIFTKKGTLGQTGFVPKLDRFDKFLVSSNQMKLSVNQTIADPLFVYYLVSSPSSRRRIVRDSEATGVPKTNLAYLRTFPICLPPLLEQRAIAQILGALDDKIELNRRMNQTLEEMARAIFKSWFVDFDPVDAKASGEQPPGLDPAIAALFPDSFVETELGLVPTGWTVEEIGKIVAAVGGGTPSTAIPEYWDEGDHWFATPKDLSNLRSPILFETERKVTEAGLRKISSGLLPTGTVLMSSRAPIGYLALTAVPVCVNQGFIAMACKGPVSNYYVLNWVRTNMSSITANAGGTTFAEISKKNFRPIPALVPAAEIAEHFDALVAPMYGAIENHDRECKSLTELRDTLLPKLMSGELQVSDF